MDVDVEKATIHFLEVYQLLMMEDLKAHKGKAEFIRTRSYQSRGKPTPEGRSPSQTNYLVNEKIEK